MKPLPEILRDALLLLDSDGRESVVIARGQEQPPLDARSVTYQFRIRLDKDMYPIYRCETRGWLGEQWSNWTERGGWLRSGVFDVDDVLATDWRIAS